MEERWIKRYANRKMYDVAESRYVSLGDLAELIRSGESIRVTDKSGSEDFTAQVLRQIIVDQSRQSDASSVPALHEWIRMGGSFLDERWDEIRSSMEGWIEGSKKRLLKGLNREDYSTLQNKVEELEKKIEELDQQKPESKQ
ncbi:MAG: polyhydroxyalkanoate synthesis regulator DNA-binding domain-containing protein [Cyclonatronaceae bacterium]